MNPKSFLRIGGSVLVTIGALGVVHLLSRISSASLFNPPPWINWFHLLLGTCLLIVAFSQFASLQTGMTLIGAIIGTTIGLVGLVLGSWAAKHYNIPELSDPSDHLAHLTVGLVAFWALRHSRPNSPPSASTGSHSAA